MFHSDEPGGPAAEPATAGQPVERPRPCTCGICGRRFDFAASQHRPFCSARCQQVDLGRWLGEAYGFPVEPEVPADTGD